MTDALLKTLLNPKPDSPRRFWAAYFDARGNEAGPRDPFSGTPMDIGGHEENNGGGEITFDLVFPVSSVERPWVCEVRVVDTPQGEGNVYFVACVTSLNKGDQLRTTVSVSG